MSQNDFVIDDSTGDVVLNDINSALQALASNSKEQNAPSTSYPSQFFANESSGKLSYRDGSDPSTYYNLANLDGGLFVDQTSTFNGDVIFQGDNGSSSFQIVYDSSANDNKGALIAKDETRIMLGTDQDFVISHSVGFNFLASETDTPVLIQGKTSNAVNNAAIELLTAPSTGTSEKAYQAYLNGGQKLYFDGSTNPKLETTADGIEVTGSILPTTDNDKPLGSSSKRFSTLHSGALNTGDINMSNLNDNANEVDGSKGSWSIQEGSDDLFLINRINGKKYKFNLTEVS